MHLASIILATGRPRPHAAFVTVCLLSVIVFWHPLCDWVSLSLAERRYSHLVLMPLISGLFLALERRKIFAQMVVSPRAGIPLLAGSLLLYGIAACGVTNLAAGFRMPLLILTFSLVAMSGFGLCYGMAALRAARFPLLLMLFMVPVPSPWMDAVVAVLQRGAAEGSNALFTLLGTPMFRDGMIFELQGGLTIQIAPECSSIHSSWALLITGVLVGHLFLRSPGSKLCLAAVTVPIAMFTNSVRIVTLSLLSLHVDRGFLTGGLHQRGGILFSLISLSILLAFLLLLGKIERRSRPAAPAAPAREAQPLAGRQ